MRAYRSDAGDFLYEFDALYDGEEQPAAGESYGTKIPPAKISGYRAAMLTRRAMCDTIVVSGPQGGIREGVSR